MLKIETLLNQHIKCIDICACSTQTLITKSKRRPISKPALEYDQSLVRELYESLLFQIWLIEITRTGTKIHFPHKHNQTARGL